MLLNLHSHLEGCVRPETAIELASHSGQPTPPGGWDAAMVMTEPGDLTAFLRHVAVTYPLLTTRQALIRVAREAVEDAHADGQEYLEIRFGPATHAGPQLSLRDVVAAVDEGVREGAAATGLPAGLIVCMLRHHPAEVNDAVAQAACDLAGSAVVGLDLAGDERLFPSLPAYVPMFARARAAGLGITVHAGEAAPGEAVQEAVTLFQTRRIGHGSRLADRPDLMAWAAQEEVTLEVCPSSNVLTGAATSLREHPIASFLEAGCRVVLGDDDPVTTRVRLSTERDLLHRELALTHKQLCSISEAAVDAAFCSPSVRRRLRERLVA